MVAFDVILIYGDLIRISLPPRTGKGLGHRRCCRLRCRPAWSRRCAPSSPITMRCVVYGSLTVCERCCDMARVVGASGGWSGSACSKRDSRGGKSTRWKARTRLKFTYLPAAPPSSLDTATREVLRFRGKAPLKNHGFVDRHCLFVHRHRTCPSWLDRERVRVGASNLSGREDQCPVSGGSGTSFHPSKRERKRKAMRIHRCLSAVHGGPGVADYSGKSMQ